jgi:hypothetical protein
MGFVCGNAPQSEVFFDGRGDEIEIPKRTHLGQRTGRVSGSSAGPWDFAGFFGVPFSSRWHTFAACGAIFFVFL